MRLVHFTSEPLVRVERRAQAAEPLVYRKPSGLWVSDEHAEQSWSQWCLDEGFRDTSAQRAYEVRVKPDRVLLIESAEALAEFDDEFAACEARGGRPLDWARVARFYDGVVITPYQWAHRLSLDWYYGWDCASGCLWNPECVESIELMALAARPSGEERGAAASREAGGSDE